MRIITPPREKWTKKCQNCMCEFEYELKDVKVSYIGVHLHRRYIHCPGCGEQLGHPIG